MFYLLLFFENMFCLIRIRISHENFENLTFLFRKKIKFRNLIISHKNFEKKDN